MKKKIIIVLMLLVIILVVGIVYVKVENKKVENQPNNVETKQESQITQVDGFIGELSDGTKINTNAKMNEPKDVGNFRLDNIRLTLKNGITTFRANVTNKTENKTELESVTLKLLDENGEELVSVKGIINEIESGKSEELAISITSNYINACGYEVIED